MRAALLLALLTVAAPARADTPRGRVLVSASAGTGLLFGCCGGSVTAEYSLGLRGGVRVWRDLAVVVDGIDRIFVGAGGSQSHGAVTVGPQVRLGPAHARVGLGVDFALGHAGSAVGPMFDYGNAFALEGALGIEPERGGRFGLLLELTAAVCFYDRTYKELALTLGFEWQ